MKIKCFWLAFTLVVVLSLVFVSCSTETSSPSSTSTPVQISSTAEPTTTTSHWWDSLGVPQYGGQIIHRMQNLDALAFDPTSATVQARATYWLENLFMPDWTLDRNIWSFKVGWAPVEYYTGNLVETWEQPNTTTLVLHLREGITWQNKYPTNGREFVADDVAYNFDRILGTGHGYTNPNPTLGNTYKNVSKVTVIDKNTVQITLNQPSLFTVIQIVSSGIAIQAKEWLELGGFVDNPAMGGGGGPPPGEGGEAPAPAATAAVGGPLTEWQNVTGTGPWILSDLVMGSSMTFAKNPDYWAYDERYPQNKLPYLDSVKEIAIADMQTSVAAIRTGKVDIIADKDGPTWQMKKTISDTNPELQWSEWPAEGWSLAMRTDLEPFTDIRVRTALQMAIDTKAIAASIYAGTVDGTPVGIMNPVLKGWTTPFAEWPSDLQKEYSFNPEGATQLLAEAGYPNGFKTEVQAPSAFPLELLEVIKSEFSDIGVEMEIKPVDMAVHIQMLMTGQNKAMVMDQGCGMPGSPLANLQKMKGGFMMNFTHNDDAEYDKMYDEFNIMVETEAARALAKKMELYALQQHWSINTFPPVSYIVWTPYVKGYMGEGTVIFSRLWVDQSSQ